MQKFLVVLLASPLCLAAPQIGFGDASDEEIAQIRSGTYLEAYEEIPQYNFNYKVADDLEQTYLSANENRDGDLTTGSYQYVDPLGSLIIVTYSAGPMGYTETREVKDGFVKIAERKVKTSSATSGASASRFSGASNSASFAGGASNSASFNGGASNTASFNGGASNSGSRTSSINSATQTSSASAFSTEDLIAAVLAQIQPLISSSVSSAVSNSARVSTVATAPVAIPLVRIPVPVAPVAPVAPIAPVAVASNAGSLTDLFGNSGAFSVRINTPTHNIEY